jgi:hypothetical protein
MYRTSLLWLLVVWYYLKAGVECVLNESKSVLQTQLGLGTITIYLSAHAFSALYTSSSPLLCIVCWLLLASSMVQINKNTAQAATSNRKPRA